MKECLPLRCPPKHRLLKSKLDCILASVPKSPHKAIVELTGGDAIISKESALESAKDLAKSKGGFCHTTVYQHSKQLFEWQCSKGHKWSAQWYSVVGSKKPTWCPYCSGRLAVKGVNDLATINPLLAAEWHATLNEGLRPESVLPNSNKVVWWNCRLGHSWKADCANRHGQGTGCPYCSGHKILPGFNDLATTEPEIAKLWDYSRNDCAPTQVKRTSNKSAYWLCSEGHQSKTWIPTKVYSGGSCSICSSKELVAGVNDLETLAPKIAATWHPIKNLPALPSMVSPSSNKYFWWLCERGHDWSAPPNNRAERGCPYCANKKCWPSFNDLATTHPDLALSWDYSLNGDLKPTQVIAGSPKSVFWVCSKGHHWPSSLANRRVHGCPTCAEYGFRPENPAFLYFLINRDIRARKVGITNVTKSERRLGGFKERGWEVLKLVEHESGFLIRALETSVLKSWLRNELELAQELTKEDMAGMNGHTETFGMEGPSNSDVIAKIEITFKSLSTAFDTDMDLFLSTVSKMKSRQTS